MTRILRNSLINFLNHGGTHRDSSTEQPLRAAHTQRPNAFCNGDLWRETAEGPHRVPRITPPPASGPSPFMVHSVPLSPFYKYASLFIYTKSLQILSAVKHIQFLIQLIFIVYAL